MFKISTRRDQHEEEALRQEGREALLKEQRENDPEDWKKWEIVYVKDTETIPVQDLKVGDYVYRSPHGLANGHRGELITYVSDHYPDRKDEHSYNGQPCRDGTFWVEYQGDLERGVRGSGGSLLYSDDKIIVCRDKS